MAKLEELSAMVNTMESKNDTFYTVKVTHEEKENSTISTIILLVYSNYLTKIPNYLTKIPKITSKQRTVLEALHLLGYRYLACDCIHNALKAYNTRPYKLEAIWYSETPKIRVNSITKMLENLCSWEDEKPTSIEWLLGKKGNNE